MDSRDLEAAARERLDPMIFDYFAGGADDERTLTEAPLAWRHWRLRPHVLRDVSSANGRTRLLGRDVAAPIGVAPMAFQRLAHDDGERATVAAAAELGLPVTVSTFATVTLEELAAIAPDAVRWFQLYVHRDRGLTLDLVARAEAAGYAALILTVDVPVQGHRRRDEVNRFRLPTGLGPVNLAAATLADGPGTAGLDGSALAAYAARQFDPTLTVTDVAWLVERTSLPVVVKGIVRGDDAAAVVDAGAAAIGVSTHGGRQLDTLVASADALPEVAEAVDGRAEVLVDGGVRRGTDVVTALALGADAVLVGRPVLWGLATGGQAGVAHVLGELVAETERAMALCGVPSPEAVTADLVTRHGSWPQEG